MSAAAGTARCNRKFPNAPENGILYWTQAKDDVSAKDIFAMQMQGDKAANRFKSNHNPLIIPPRQDIGAPWQSADTYRDTQTGKTFVLDEGEYIEARHSVQSLRKGYTFSNNRGFRKVDEDAARVRSFVSELLASDGITARQT